MKPVVVLCMAGLYKRFRDAHYTVPKYLLPVEGRPMLQLIADALTPRIELVAVANLRDRGHEEAIRAALPDAALHFVGDTSGQAETAALGAARVTRMGDPVLFHNVDTLVLGRDLLALGARLSQDDGVIDVFPSTSPAYSYVGVDDAMRVRAIAEKVVISAHATTGLYGFASAATYLRWASQTSARSGGEFYISDVYRTMVEAGAVVRAVPAAPGAATIVLGTPAEYEAHVARR